MKHTTANLLLLLATIIWGTAFVAQTTGMGYIGPFTFSFARFFLGMLIVLPFALILEKKNIIKIFFNQKLIILCFFTGLALFLGMGLQQYSLLKSQISNAAFFSTLYVPIVAIISRFLFNSRVTWIIWIAVLLCIYGSYLLSSNQVREVQQSDMLVLLAAFFFAIHIILIDIFLKNSKALFSFAFLQYTIVFFCSLVVAFAIENPKLENIKLEWFEIVYTGVFSTGVGYTLQIIGQSKASPAPAAIILSMESVFAVVAGWIILNQTLDMYKIFGCCLIFFGVLLVQLFPIYLKKKFKTRKSIV